MESILETNRLSHTFCYTQREVYRVDGKLPPWNGTVWKAYAKRRMRSPNLDMQVVHVDWGVGVIRRGSQTLFPETEEINWMLLDSQREELLNLVSIDQFLSLH